MLQKNEEYEVDNSNFSKEQFFSELKHDYLVDEELERTDDFLEAFTIENRKKITEMHLKSVVFLLADKVEKIISFSIGEFWRNHYIV